MKKTNINWNQLYSSFYHEMVRINQDRYLNLLKNHEFSKEKVCRKLGIVTMQDVIRLSRHIEKRK